MNCSEARDLFSSRLDEELEPQLLATLDKHLINCDDCQIAWSSFRSTVGLVRSLPAREADASFVGSVLDRVRAYELEDAKVALTPMDKAPSSSVLQGLARRVRDWMADFEPRALLQPAPAMALGCLFLGLGVGAGVSTWMGGPGSTAVADGTLEAVTPALTSAPMIQGAASGEPIDVDHAMANPNSTSPFSDLADEIRTQESSISSSTPLAVVRPGRDANSGLQQQVGYRNESARIIF